MVLVDTSVWVDFLRKGDNALSALLSQNSVCMHSMIIGELACGHLRNRGQLIGLWENLPQITEASHEEALYCLNAHKLMGRGIGFIDLHLLASTLLTPGVSLWSHDRRLTTIASSLHIGFSS